MTTLSIGQVIPDFSAQATSERVISPQQLRGKWVVLYFYPKDNTPGCTTEGNDFREHYDEFKALNADIFGVSGDSLVKHDKFKAKYDFPFDLITDPEFALCQSFGAYGHKKLYGKSFLGIIRSTFLIDEQGILRHTWPKVRVKGHVDEVLSTLKSLVNE